MKTIFILLAVFFSANVLLSQDKPEVISAFEDEKFKEEFNILPEPKVTFELDITAAFTSGQFKEFYPKDGMGGIGLSTLFPLSIKNPLDVGFEFGYYFMSETRDKFEYHAPFIGVYDVYARVSGSMVPFHIIARVYPLKNSSSPVQPYVEGLAGFRLFVVNQEVNAYIVSSGEELPRVTVTNTTGSWSYGFGAGVKIKVSKNNLLYLNAKANQLYGTETNYMDPSSVALYENGTVEYSSFRSRTDVLRFSIGLHLMIE